MDSARLKQINELYLQLRTFKDDCNIAPKVNEDLKKYWIIDDTEARLIDDLMDLLEDCGVKRVV